MSVSFVCLANSRKGGGRCVAGLRTDGGGWIRPVSQDPDGTLRRREYVLDDGSEAQLLDIIQVTVPAPRPEPHQPENWVLGARRWKLISRLHPRAAWKELAPSLKRGPNLLGNQSDRVSYSQLKRHPTDSSLALVKPSAVSWVISESVRRKRQTRARFRLGSVAYDLVVTDPQWESRLSHCGLGVHDRVAAGISARDRLLFTISLGEPFHGECFKLVAAVVLIPPA